MSASVFFVPHFDLKNPFPRPTHTHSDRRRRAIQETIVLANGASRLSWMSVTVIPIVLLVSTYLHRFEQMWKHLYE